MPLLHNKFQPFFPDPDSPNNYQCGTEQYCHPIALGDLIYNQFTQTPCNPNEIEDPEFADYTLGAEILLNPSFTGNANNWVTASGALPSDDWAYDSNNIRHTTGTQLPVYQTGTGMVVGSYYQIQIDITRTSGSVRVRLGQTAGSTVTEYFEETGSYTVVLPFLDAGVGDDTFFIEVNDTDDFDGTVNSVSLKLVTYNKWAPNGSWNFSDGFACHIDGTTGILEETVTDYIVVGGYYELTVTATGVITGELDVYVSDILVGTITGNGIFTFYTPEDDLPAVTGVVSFDPSSDFVGCISAPDLRQLKIDHLAYVVDSEGNEYQIGEYFSYYQRYVTLIFDISLLELQYGCYTLKVVDACVVAGDNLIENGDFSDGSADWILNNGGYQYDFSGNEAEFIFDPITGIDYITNGDFATGDFTGWTAGAGWAVVGNKAQHTAGSTAVLEQSVTIPAPLAPPLVYNYWIELTISGRTAGSVTVTLGDKSRTTLLNNDAMIFSLRPTTSGSILFTITPTSDFDGSIDDIAVHYSTQIWTSTPAITSAANTDMIAGNYEIEFEITSNSDSLIAVGAKILGSTVPYTYFTTVGTHTISVQNYVPGAQQVQFIARFENANYGIKGSVAIDNVVVRPVEPFEATYESECLQYALEFDHSRMIVAYCDKNNLGFEFENSGFVLQQRVVCRSFNPSYPGDTLIQNSGTGSARITYADLSKTWRLDTDWASETFHDCFAAQQKCDHLLIGTAQDNGTEYIFTADEYQPDWRAEGDYSLAPVTGTVRIKDNGQIFNRHY